MALPTRELIRGSEDMAKKRPAAEGETWVAVRLPEAAKDQLEEMARQQERSVSFVLRKLVLDALAREREQEQ